MQMLLSLWQPILISSVVVFFASFAAWVLLPHHKPEWTGVPDEAGLAKALNAMKMTAGQYMFPFAVTNEEMKSAEFKQRMEAGPCGTIIVWAGPSNMGKNMLCTYLFFLGASFCLAYLGTLGLEPGADFMKVFRFIGTAGILTYCAAGVPNAIWFRRKILMDILDGAAYGLLTGVVFGLLWPAA